MIAYQYGSFHPPHEIAGKRRERASSARPLSSTGSPSADTVCPIEPTANGDRWHGAIQTIPNHSHMTSTQYGRGSW